MPRWIFWAGVVASAVVALVALGWGVNALWHPRIDLPGSSAWLEQSGAAFGTGALILTLPLAALILRMAARLAPRRLFDAIVTVFAVTGASIALLGTSVLLTQGGAETSSLSSAGLALSTVFAALAVLSLKPYFEIQSSRTLSLLVMAPLPLAVSLVGLLLWSGESIDSARRIFSALALVSAASLTGITVHAARHRQMFTEPTGLRRLLAVTRRQDGDEGGDSIPLSREPLANG